MTYASARRKVMWRRDHNLIADPDRCQSRSAAGHWHGESRSSLSLMGVAALGDKRSDLLAHHGLLCTAEAIQEATYLALNPESASRLQLRAMVGSGIQPVGPAHARDARELLLSREIVDASFHREARRMLATDEAII